MNRTALILAGAVVFDLGVMAVSAQAQTPPGRGDDFVNQGLITNSNSKLSAAPAEPATPPPAADVGGPRSAPVVDPTGPGRNGGCTPGLPTAAGGPCNPAAISDQAAQGNLSFQAPTGPAASAFGPDRPTKSKGGRVEYFKIDRVNTIQACSGRGGEVVMHEGARQCRIPADDGAAAAPSIGNPARRPGGIPPRN